ncbi:MAG: hypothetical protein A4E70_02018 [Syntrophus sp. PtaU1.Bin005]|nr:MAG: hypothetical protein A4E70_02018 [Syntrophus sp. PtaU1.Bin005]
MNDLGEGGQTVGGARGVGDDRLAVIALVVDSHDEHRRVILGWRGKDDLFRPGGKMSARLLLVEEKSRRFYDIVGPDVIPFQICGVFFSRDANRLAIDHQLAVLYIHGSLEPAVYRVIPEHIGHVIRIEQIVDPHNFNVRPRTGGAENQPADSAETINANFDRHVNSSLKRATEIEGTDIVPRQKTSTLIRLPLNRQSAAAEKCQIPPLTGMN